MLYIHGAHAVHKGTRTHGRTHPPPPTPQSERPRTPGSYGFFDQDLTLDSRLSRVKALCSLGMGLPPLCRQGHLMGSEIDNSSHPIASFYRSPTWGPERRSVLISQSHCGLRGTAGLQFQWLVPAQCLLHHTHSQMAGQRPGPPTTASTCPPHQSP